MLDPAIAWPRLLAVSEKCPHQLLNRESWSVRSFVFLKEVGSGAASTVYYAMCQRTAIPCAIKVYNKSKLSKLNRRQVESEINIHSSLHHAHIVEFYAAFEDEERVYLVQEFAAGGDLFDDVKQQGGRLPEIAVVRQILQPYLSVLLYLHSKGIIHRDVKPENTVFTKDRVMKVTDFGLAIDADTERPVTRLGTLDYMAPEVLCCPDKFIPSENKDRLDLVYGPSVDVWAVGILAYELLVGRPPFSMPCRDDTMDAISRATPILPEWMSRGAASFIMSALQRQPEKRASVQSLIQHPWIVSYEKSYEDVYGVLNSSPLRNHVSLPAVNVRQEGSPLACSADASLRHSNSWQQQHALSYSMNAVATCDNALKSNANISGSYQRQHPLRQPHEQQQAGYATHLQAKASSNLPGHYFASNNNANGAVVTHKQQQQAPYEDARGLASNGVVPPGTYQHQHPSGAGQSAEDLSTKLGLSSVSYEGGVPYLHYSAGSKESDIALCPEFSQQSVVDNCLHPSRGPVHQPANYPSLADDASSHCVAAASSDLATGASSNDVDNSFLSLNSGEGTAAWNATGSPRKPQCTNATAHVQAASVFRSQQTHVKHPGLSVPSYHNYQHHLQQQQNSTSSKCPPAFGSLASVESVLHSSFLQNVSSVSCPTSTPLGNSTTSNAHNPQVSKNLSQKTSIPSSKENSAEAETGAATGQLLSQTSNSISHFGSPFAALLAPMDSVLRSGLNTAPLAGSVEGSNGKPVTGSASDPEASQPVPSDARMEPRSPQAQLQAVVDVSRPASKGLSKEGLKRAPAEGELCEDDVPALLFSKPLQGFLNRSMSEMPHPGSGTPHFHIPDLFSSKSVDVASLMDGGDWQNTHLGNVAQFSGRSSRRALLHAQPNAGRDGPLAMLPHEVAQVSMWRCRQELKSGEKSAKRCCSGQSSEGAPVLDAADEGLAPGCLDGDSNSPPSDNKVFFIARGVSGRSDVPPRASSDAEGGEGARSGMSAGYGGVQGAPPSSTPPCANAPETLGGMAASIGSLSQPTLGTSRFGRSAPHRVLVRDASRCLGSIEALGQARPGVVSVRSSVNEGRNGYTEQSRLQDLRLVAQNEPEAGEQNDLVMADTVMKSPLACDVHNGACAYEWGDSHWAEKPTTSMKDSSFSSMATPFPTWLMPQDSCEPPLKIESGDSGGFASDHGFTFPMRGGGTSQEPAAALPQPKSLPPRGVGELKNHSSYVLAGTIMEQQQEHLVNACHTEGIASSEYNMDNFYNTEGVKLKGDSGFHDDYHPRAQGPIQIWSAEFGEVMLASPEMEPSSPPSVGTCSDESGGFVAVANEGVWQNANADVVTPRESGGGTYWRACPIKNMYGSGRAAAGCAQDEAPSSHRSETCSRNLRQSSDYASSQLATGDFSHSSWMNDSVSSELGSQSSGTVHSSASYGYHAHHPHSHHHPQHSYSSQHSYSASRLRSVAPVMYMKAPMEPPNVSPPLPVIHEPQFDEPPDDNYRPDWDADMDPSLLRVLQNQEEDFGSGEVIMHEQVPLSPLPQGEDEDEQKHDEEHYPQHLRNSGVSGEYWDGYEEAVYSNATSFARQQYPLASRDQQLAGGLYMPADPYQVTNPPPLSRSQSQSHAAALYQSMKGVTMHSAHYGGAYRSESAVGHEGGILEEDEAAYDMPTAGLMSVGPAAAHAAAYGMSASMAFPQSYSMEYSGHTSHPVAPSRHRGLGSAMSGDYGAEQVDDTYLYYAPASQAQSGEVTQVPPSYYQSASSSQQQIQQYGEEEAMCYQYLQQEQQQQSLGVLQSQLWGGSGSQEMMREGAGCAFPQPTALEQQRWLQQQQQQCSAEYAYQDFYQQQHHQQQLLYMQQQQQQQQQLLLLQQQQKLALPAPHSHVQGGAGSALHYRTTDATSAGGNAEDFRACDGAVPVLADGSCSGAYARGHMDAAHPKGSGASACAAPATGREVPYASAGGGDGGNSRGGHMRAAGGTSPSPASATGSLASVFLRAFQAPLKAAGSSRS